MKTVHDIISGKQALPGNDTWDEIENFLGIDWSLSYELYNPENFEDPDNAPQWYDPKDCYTFSETPTRSPHMIEISGANTPENIFLLKEILENHKTIESTLLSYLVNYTFHDGGAYAAWKYFYFAKKTIEKSENIVFENEEDFMKHCLYIEHISLTGNGSDWKLWVCCAWDTEHGMELYFNKTNLVSGE